MEHPILYLNESEQLALSILSNPSGYGYTEVKRKLGITSSALCPLLAAIRRKTGIADTKNVEQVQRYLTAYEQSSGQPDEKQREILCRITGIGYRLEGAHTMEGASYRMKISLEETRQLYANALKTVGIFTPDPREQRVQARVFLAARHVSTTRRQPMTDNHLRALRLYATTTAQPSQIAEMLGAGFSEDYVKMLLQQGTARLGVSAKGRGVQRRLVKLSLERYQREQLESEPVSPEDPMF